MTRDQATVCVIALVFIAAISAGIVLMLGDIDSNLSRIIAIELKR